MNQNNNLNEIKDLKTLRKYFLFMFSWIIGLIILFFIGFIIVIVMAIVFRQKEGNNNPLLYSLVIYLILFFIGLTIYFVIGAKGVKFLNNNPVALIIYEHQDIFKNPFILKKEAKKISNAINELSKGATIKEIKEQYFYVNSQDLK
ncbi:hypothetical protein [Mycoplasmoides pirum]|uniref:hypothetical protein n=1 Tax=Mycoplasmoides pirum TaxID=2122 RepID=UPI000560EA3B|nr:hypothetical protein [Mycoplasmoides pirum]